MRLWPVIWFGPDEARHLYTVSAESQERAVALTFQAFPHARHARVCTTC